MRTLIDSAAVGRGLNRMAGEIVERNGGVSELVLIGIRRGGPPVAAELRERILKLESGALPVGSVDITLYRDDAASAMPNPRIGPSSIPVPLADRRVLLVDDVISTGRTVRAALDAILDYGRPRCVQLAAVVDRGGRELPIQPDYLVRACGVGSDERVDVVQSEEGLSAVVLPYGSPSMPPASAPGGRE